MIKFYLYHSQFNKPVLIEAPEGWDSLNLTVRRDRQWHGVFFEYSPRLRFVKKGKAVLHNLVEIFGIQAECALIVLRRNPQTRKWEQEYEGAVNFAEYKISKLYFECNIENTGFVQRFKNAQDVKYKLAGSGVVNLHSQGLRKTSQLTTNADEGAFSTAVYGSIGLGNTHYLLGDMRPLKDDLQEFFSYQTQLTTTDPVATKKYTWKLKERGSYTLRINFEGDLTSSAATVFTQQWKLVYGTTGNYTTVNLNNTALANGFYNVTHTLNADLPVGTEIYVFAEVVASVIGGIITVRFQSYRLIFTPPNPIPAVAYTELTGVTYTDSSTAYIDYVFEAFDQVITNMVGAAGRLRSSLYGRTDSPLVYPADGAGALRAITSGNNIRGQNNLFASFADMYRTFNLLDNIGVGIRKENGVEVVDIEPLAHFYAGREVMRLNFVSDLEKASDTEQYYNELEIGYETQLEENAQQEFNRKREFEFPITKVKRKLALMAPYTTAGTIIEQRRREAQAALDSRVDNNNFVIQLRRDGALLVPAKNEGFTSVTGVDAPESLYNLALAPARLLRKHGNKFSAFLHKIGGIIAARFNEGNNTLSTQLAAEAAPISEAADVAVNSLATRMYDAEVYTFRKQLTHQQIQALKNDPYGYISFSESDRDHKRMYVLKAERDATTREVKFTGLKAY